MPSRQGKPDRTPELIGLLSIPSGSKVPDPHTGRSTGEEYDRYFRLVRDQPGLARWSRTCIDALDRQLADLEASALGAEDRCRILEGMLLVQRMTLERWVTLSDEEEGTP